LLKNKAPREAPGTSMTKISQFNTKDGDCVELVCGFDHSFEGWPEGVQVRNVQSGEQIRMPTNDLRPLDGLTDEEVAQARDKFRALLFALPECENHG
jgi:hypothetical protein